MTTGIRLRIVTEAMYEKWEAGAAFDDLPPVWRAIGPKAPILKTVSFDPAFLIDRRAAEGLPVRGAAPGPDNGLSAGGR